jgi:hypothetical protein
METDEKDWIHIQQLIGREKADGSAELRRRPLMKPGRELRQAFSGRRMAFLPAAAALLLTVALGILWTILGEWHSVSSGGSSDSLLAGTFLYSSPREADLPDGRRPSASPNFTAWAAAALQKTAAANEGLPVVGDGQAPVEHGDPAAMRLRLSEAIRGNVFSEFLSRYKKIHDKEV